MKLPVFKRDGSKTSESVEIPDSLLSGEPNDHAIWLAVRSEEAARRQGTASTKNRKFVRGGGRKPFKQKGRGMARQGTIRSPLMPGGGTIFGPKPHKYSVGVPEKVRKTARRSALLHKLRDEKVRIVEDFGLATPKTAEIAGILNALGLDNEKVLLLVPEFDLAIHKSTRNMARASMQKAEAASARDLMNCTTVLFQKSAVSKLVKVLDHAA